jgi:hypothetical protein
MKAFICLLTLVLPLLLVAQPSPSNSDGKTIVIQESPGKVLGAPKVFVESGKEDLSGSPEEGLKPAYRTWESRCKEWKAELKHMNGNNLMIVNCGTPKKSVETIQSEKYYTYSSTGTYKIKVVGK